MSTVRIMRVSNLGHRHHAATSLSIYQVLRVWQLPAHQTQRCLKHGDLYLRSTTLSHEQTADSFRRAIERYWK